MIKEEYVSFEVAKLLKEKGFDESCDNSYTKDGEFVSNLLIGHTDGESIIVSNQTIFPYKAPTQQMAMRWLREEKHICIEPYSYDHRFVCGFSKLPECVSIFCEQEYSEYDSYEEAVEAAIKYCLENLL